MSQMEARRYAAFCFLFFPIAFWFAAVKKTVVLTDPKIISLLEVIKTTHERPILIASIFGGLLLGAILGWLIIHISKTDFKGAHFKRYLRGTKMMTSDSLKSKTREKKTDQVEVCDIPMPSKIEPLHLLLNGSTGTGKSVLLRSMVFSILKRKDRLIVLDPNGDMYSKFGTDNDKILNPYDERTEGWVFYNEIRSDYDYDRYSQSLVPKGKTDEAEEWASYGRLLLRETARKLSMMGDYSIKSLRNWTNIASQEDLRAFLEGTDAEALFAGSSEASKAFTSARFILSGKIDAHERMPSGNFSIRKWLEDPNGGNLYITWREDMATALKPLISAWVDVICTSILSMPEDEDRRIWLLLDELASLDKLASLEAALTKGRKAGLRVAAGLQSTAQLDNIYGRDEAQVLRSCFRSLVVLGGSRTDHKTADDMSQSLGEHEVERERRTRSSGSKSSTSTGIEVIKERVVSPSEISSLPELTAYVAFAGDYPITRTVLKPISFVQRNEPFKEAHKYGHA